MLFEIDGLPIGIVIPYLVHVIASALIGSLLVIAGAHILGEYALQSVPHEEVFVELLVGARNQFALIDVLSPPVGVTNFHPCRPGLHPHKLPVEI